MKTIICLLILVASVSMKPGKPARRFLAEENDPEFRRFLPIEKANGQIEVVDLKETREVIITAERSDVTYYLFTRNNLKDPYTITNGEVSQLQGSLFDPSKKSLFISHGWRNSYLSVVNTEITSAALANYDLNVFVVDWSKPANADYFSAMNSATLVGQYKADFINDIQSKYNLTGSAFVLIGHSLGAHVAGNAGSALKSKVDYLVGLDPASPLYSLSRTDNRIDPSDAHFVQIIHTNGALLGFYSSIGHVDYFPNGGKKQPGCGLDMTGSCSHGKAYRYFAESLYTDRKYLSFLCSSYEEYQEGSCADNEKALMGQLEPVRVDGDYYLDTSSEQPYALG